MSGQIWCLASCREQPHKSNIMHTALVLFTMISFTVVCAPANAASLLYGYYSDPVQIKLAGEEQPLTLIIQGAASRKRDEIALVVDGQSIAKGYIRQNSGLNSLLLSGEHSGIEFAARCDLREAQIDGQQNNMSFSSQDSNTPAGLQTAHCELSVDGQKVGEIPATNMLYSKDRARSRTDR